MPPSKTRFVTACQQVLALGVVVAALTPAASVVSLDVVREQPGQAGAAVPAAALSAYTRAQARTSVLPAGPVDPKVRAVALTAAPAAGSRGKVAGLTLGRVTTNARSKPGMLPGSTEVTSIPEPVTGYGAIGVTWAHGVQMTEQQLSFQLRTRPATVCDHAAQLPYAAVRPRVAESEGGRHARPGTGPVIG